MKLCTKCGKKKRLEMFALAKGKKDGRKSQCKACVNKQARACTKETTENRREYHKRWRLRNKEKLKEQGKRYREENGAHQREYAKVYYIENKPEALRRAKNSSYKRRYGLTVNDVERMRKAQGGKCACCGKRENNLMVDHDHATGLVRALLCRGCNTALGFIKDDVKIAEALAVYLTKMKKREVSNG